MKRLIKKYLDRKIANTGLQAFSAFGMPDQESFDQFMHQGDSYLSYLENLDYLNQEMKTIETINQNAPRLNRFYNALGRIYAGMSVGSFTALSIINGQITYVPSLFIAGASLYCFNKARSLHPLRLFKRVQSNMQRRAQLNDFFKDGLALDIDTKARLELGRNLDSYLYGAHLFRSKKFQKYNTETYLEALSSTINKVMAYAHKDLEASHRAMTAIQLTQKKLIEMIRNYADRVGDQTLSKSSARIIPAQSFAMLQDSFSEICQQHNILTNIKNGKVGIEAIERYAPSTNPQPIAVLTVTHTYKGPKSSQRQSDPNVPKTRSHQRSNTGLSRSL